MPLKPPLYPLFFFNFLQKNGMRRTASRFHLFKKSNVIERILFNFGQFKDCTGVITLAVTFTT